MVNVLIRTSGATSSASLVMQFLGNGSEEVQSKCPCLLFDEMPREVVCVTACMVSNMGATAQLLGGSAMAIIQPSSGRACIQWQ